jgi:hypothetical protein
MSFIRMTLDPAIVATLSRQPNRKACEKQVAMIA